MKKRILAYLCLPFLLPFFTQCDLVEEDSMPNSAIDGGFNHKATVMHNSATVIDLAPQDSPDGVVFSLATQPLFGEAEIKANKYLLYKQSKNTNSDKDVFNLRACSGEDCETGIIELNIVNSQASLPCGFIAMADAFSLPQTLPPMQEAYFLPVLENDLFCSATPDSTQLIAVVQPNFGQLVPGINGFQYIPFDATAAAPFDEFIYQVRSQNGTQIAYAPVRITFDSLATCQALPKAENDYFELSYDSLQSQPEELSFFLDILANDFYCDSQFGVNIASQPSIGEVTVAEGSGGLTYKVSRFEISEADSLSFKYEIVHQNAVASSAEVVIFFHQEPVCDALPAASDDQYLFVPADPSVDDFSMELPVIENDLICDYSAAHIEILEAPEVGMAFVKSDKFTLEFALNWGDTQQLEEARFVYGIFHHNVLETQAEVTLDLSSLNCTIKTQQDFFYGEWNNAPEFMPMDVLANDQACNAALSIETQPTYGQVVVDTAQQVINYYFTDAAVAFGEDRFTYKLTNNITGEAVLGEAVLFMSPDPNCESTTVPDEFIFTSNADSLDLTEFVYLSILQNDEACNGTLIVVEELPESGQVQVAEDGMGILFRFDEQPGSNAEDRFTYSLSLNGDRSNISEVIIRTE